MRTAVVAPVGQFDVEDLSLQCFKILFNGACGGMVASIHSRTYFQCPLKIRFCLAGLAQPPPRSPEVVIICGHVGMGVAPHLAMDGQSLLMILDGPARLAQIGPRSPEVVIICGHVGMGVAPHLAMD